MTREDEIRARLQDHAPEDLAYLLARVEALEAERARVATVLRQLAQDQYPSGSRERARAYEQAARIVERGTP